jgi:hypothetical protein
VGPSQAPSGGSGLPGSRPLVPYLGKFSALFFMIGDPIFYSNTLVCCSGISVRRAHGSDSREGAQVRRCRNNADGG